MISNNIVICGKKQVAEVCMLPFEKKEYISICFYRVSFKRYVRNYFVTALWEGN